MTNTAVTNVLCGGGYEAFNVVVAAPSHGTCVCLDHAVSAPRVDRTLSDARQDFVENQTLFRRIWPWSKGLMASASVSIITTLIVAR